MRIAILVLSVLLIAPVPCRAQEEHGHGGSPYVDLLERDIKALSADEVRSLLEGDGMELALPAELNGYPGPRHVLELADSLALTDAQRETTERLRTGMLAVARDLGAQIVEGERSLDRAFATGTVTEEELRDAVVRLARLRGELRAVHLSAHLAVKELLTAHQLHLYETARGYASGHEHPQPVSAEPGPVPRLRQPTTARVSAVSGSTK